MHLVIFFAGTGMEGEDILSRFAGFSNIQLITVKGCQHPETCNAWLFPNLNKFANRFIKTLFNSTNNNLRLARTDLAQLGLGINAEECFIGEPAAAENIESLILCGTSRGAVTCFEIANELHKIAPNFPVDIVAQEPVSGNYSASPGTIAADVEDCTHLKNIRRVSVILGAYTGGIKVSNVSTEDEFVKALKRKFHRKFISQVLPKFARSTVQDIIVIPRESHFEGSDNCARGFDYLLMQIAKYLYLQNVVRESFFNSKMSEAKAAYTEYPKSPLTLFPPVSQLQKIFGVRKHDLYKYADKFHPDVKARRGFELLPEESLLVWWHRHTAKVSRFTSELTKRLIATIEKTDTNDDASVLILFTQCDKWILLKNNKSPHYCYVDVLLYHVSEILIHQHDFHPSVLTNIHYENLNSTEHFWGRWYALSHSVSCVRSPETHVLDKAFAKHARAQGMALKKDEELLAALNLWISQKRDSKSKRYDIVVELRDQVAEIVNRVSATVPMRSPKLRNHRLAPINTPGLSLFRNEQLQIGLSRSELLGIPLLPIEEGVCVSPQKSFTVASLSSIEEKAISPIQNLANINAVAQPSNHSALDKYEDVDLLSHPLFRKVFNAWLPNKDYKKDVLEFYCKAINFRKGYHRGRLTVVEEANILLKAYIYAEASKRMDHHLSPEILASISSVKNDDMTHMLFLAAECETEKFICEQLLPSFKQSPEFLTILPFITLDPKQVLKDKEKRQYFKTHGEMMPEDKAEEPLVFIDPASATSNLKLRPSHAR